MLIVIALLLLLGTPYANAMAETTNTAPEIHTASTSSMLELLGHDTANYTLQPLHKEELFALELSPEAKILVTQFYELHELRNRLLKLLAQYSQAQKQVTHEEQKKLLAEKITLYSTAFADVQNNMIVVLNVLKERHYDASTNA